MIDQILKLIFKVDNKSLDASMSQAEKKSQELTNKISTGFQSAFKGLAAGIAALGIGKLFSSAIKSANDFEKAMLGVGAAAKLAGQDVTQAQSNVQKLSEDGQVSIKDSAKIFKSLTALGIDANKALTFAEAGKRVASFNGVMDTTSESLASFVKGLQTGSAELLENLDPSLQGVIKKLGGYAKVAQDATVRQKLINIVIEKGGKLQEDYNKFLDTGSAQVARFKAEQEKLSVAIGQGLQESFKGVTSLITDIVKGFREFLDTLTPGAKQALILGTAMTALIPVISTAASAFKLFQGAPNIFGAIIKAINPVTLGLTALAAVFTGIAVIIAQYKTETEKLVEAETKETTAVLALDKQITTLEKNRKKGIKSQQEEKKAKDSLIATANTLGVALKQEDLLLQNIGKTRQKLIEIQKADIQAKLIGLRITRDAFALEQRLQRARDPEAFARVQQNVTDITAASQRGSSVDTLTNLIRGVGQQLFGGGEDRAIVETTAQLAQTNLAISQLEAQLRRFAPAVDLSNNSVQNLSRSTKILNDNLFLFTDLEKKLKSINKEYSDFIKFLNQQETIAQRAGDEDKVLEIQALRFAAEKKLTEETEKEIEKRRMAFEKGNQSVFEVTKQNIDKETEARLKALNEFYTEQIKQAGDNADKILKIFAKRKKDEEKIEKEQQLKLLDSQLKNAQKGIESIQQLQQATTTGGQIGAIGGVLGQVDPAFGGIVQTGGAIASVFEDIFSNTDKLEKQEEQRQKQLEAQNLLIAAQVKLAETLTRLEQDRQKLIDKETEIELKKNAILFKDDQKRQAADLQALERLRIRQAESAGLQAGDTQSIVNQINNLSEQKVGFDSALSALGTYQQLPSGITSENALPILDQNTIALNTALGLAPTAAKASIQDAIKKNNSLKGLAQSAAATTIGSLKAAKENVLGQLAERFAPSITAAQNAVKGVTDGIDFTLERSESLFDTIKRIQDLEGRDSTGGGGSQLDLREGRRESFIDIIRGGATSRFGQFVQGVQATPRPTVSQGVGQIALATREQGQSVQQKQLKAAEDSLEVLKSMLIELIGINQAVGGSNSLSSEQVILQTLENIQNRLVG